MKKQISPFSKTEQFSSKRKESETMKKWKKENHIPHSDPVFPENSAFHRCYFRHFIFLIVAQRRPSTISSNCSARLASMATWTPLFFESHEYLTHCVAHELWTWPNCHSSCDKCVMVLSLRWWFQMSKDKILHIWTDKHFDSN